MNWLAKDFYLSFYCARNYPEQEPAADYARWYDLFWILIPIAGFMAFLLMIENRYNKTLEETQ